MKEGDIFMNSIYYSPNDFNDKDIDLTKEDKRALHMVGCLSALLIPAVLAIMFAMMLLLSSCSSIKYVPVETVRTEYINRTDTVRKTDSVFTEKETIIKEADSALIAKLGLQLKDNEKAILILKRELERQVNKESEHRIDTIIKTDSVQIPYPVEKKLSKWEQTKMNAGGISIVSCIIFIAMIIVMFIIKCFKRG